MYKISEYFGFNMALMKERKHSICRMVVGARPLDKAACDELVGMDVEVTESARVSLEDMFRSQRLRVSQCHLEHEGGDRLTWHESPVMV